MGFAPWSLLAVVALIKGKQYLNSGWWLSVIPITAMAVLMTLSGYRLPHYLNVILPFCSLLTAGYLNQSKPLGKALCTTQVIVCILALVAILLLNIWAFPIHNNIVMLGVLPVITIGAWLLLRSKLNRWLILSVVSSIVVFYLLNSNFYPQLLTYQGGITLARTTATKVKPQYVYFWPGCNSASYSFYSKSSRKNFADSVLQQTTPVWIVTETRVYGEFKQRGLQAMEVFVAKDYSTDKLNAKFINPSTRSAALDSLYLIRVK